MVFIKKVTMKGFKSYGPKKIAVTLSPGFTCIVGPNGSGKSNVVDACAFVLGLQSSKMLRAGVFSDLIYGGSKKIKASRFAEVSIYFDNSDGKLPIDSKEIVISRSIDTSGKTVYRVNKKRETRTYVVDLLAHANIFPEGHNIVMQGDITQFIKMSSEERRGIIEEISGIAEYNEKRERGQRELDRANENIARVEIVLNEVSGRLERLEKEKNDATRYKELRDEIYKNKGWLLKGELKAARNSLSRTLENISTRSERKKECEARIAQLEALIEEEGRMFTEAEVDIQGLQEGRQIDLAREIEETKGKKRMIESEMSFCRDAMEDLGKRLADFAREKGRLKEEGRTLGQGMKTFEEELSKIMQVMREKDEEYEKVIEGLSRSKDILDDSRKRLAETESALEEKRQAGFVLKTENEKMSSEIGFVKEQRKACEEELLHAKKAIEDACRLLDELSAKKEKLATAYEETKASLFDMREEEKTQKTRLYSLEDEIWRKRLRLSELGARMKARQDFETIRKNVSVGIAEIIEAGKIGIIKGIYGTIASLGKTEEEYKTALEVAAGNRMSNIVVDTDETARTCINFLKDKKSGRATFLPLNAIQGFAPRESATGEGMVDYAINLVKFKAEFEIAFRYVFGDTLVVKTIEDTKGRKGRMVTLDGDIFERSGAITGGHYVKTGYLPSFSTMTDEGEMGTLEKETESLQSERKVTENDIQEMTKRMREKERLLTQQEGELDLLSSRLEEENAYLSEKEILSKNLEQKIKDLTIIAEEKTVSIRGNVERLGGIEKEISSLEERKREMTGRLSFEGVDLRELEEEMARLRESLRKKEFEIQESKSRLNFIDSRKREIEENMGALESKIVSQRESLANFESRMQEQENLLDGKISEERMFAQTLAERKEEKERTRSLLEERRREKDALREEVFSMTSKLEVLEEHRIGHEQRIKELEEEARNYVVEGEYHDIKELRFRITSMEHEKENLEPINMRAIEEYDEVMARHALLSTRTEKLYEERKSILDFIAEVEGQKKSVFMTVFSKVAENFSKIFAELSPEGSARLLMQNEEDPFSGGLEVEANPGGKEVKRVEAMSGGEKALTALAFVFAVQRYKPAPFYILDEVDMHLDDVNCKRVAEMIKDSSKDTQFILITLRDVMMAVAELLYGVTIKSGLSKILSVRLEEISQYKEPVPTVE